MYHTAVFRQRFHSVRVIYLDERPWFVARDICGLLGIKNTGDKLARLQSFEKRYLDLEQIAMLTDDERVKRLAVVSDAGMLSMIRSSLKPEAQQIKKWALHYLIPEAKTTGGQYFQSTIGK